MRSRLHGALSERSVVASLSLGFRVCPRKRRASTQRVQSSKSRDAATLLGQLAPLHKETRALATQRFEACAGRQGVKQLAVATLPRAPAAGCDNFAASKRQRIVQAKAAAVYSLAERCSWSKLSRSSVCRVKVAAALA